MTAKPRARRLIVVLGLFLVGVGVVALGLAWVSVETMQGIAGGIRKPTDVTPQRVMRFRQVAWLLAAAGLVVGVGLIRGRQQVLAAVQQFQTAVLNWAKTMPSWSWGGRLLLLVVVPASLLRVMLLHRPVAYDEAYSYVNFASRSWYLAISDYNSPNNHLLNTLFMCVCRYWGGQSETLLRIPSLLIGVLLVIWIYRWATTWADRWTALVAAALAGCSPLLISYSVDARGYTAVAFFAVLLDHSLGRIHNGSARAALYWVLAWASLVLGFFAIPVMLYPAAGILGWFSMAPIWQANSPAGICWKERLLKVALLVGLASITVLALYAPGYVFRGTQAFENRQFDRLPLQQCLTLWWANLATGWRYWNSGPLLWWAGLPLAGAGLLWLLRDRARLFRFGFPFLSLLVIVACQGVVPPPRVLLFLAPWWYLLVAFGVRWLARRLKARRWIIYVGPVALALVTCLFPMTLQQGYLKTDVYVSIPEAVNAVGAVLEQTPGKDRLLVPVPCDLPARYYILQQGLQLPINGTPQPGETIWVLGPSEKQAAFTLRNSTVRLESWEERLGPWQVFTSLPTVDLLRFERPVR
ncbi:MAG: glycosyltransferase family 39 protein [Planctomycetota bacterium]|nr:glycosyltransferase family 39 protein [Planctomycetota bacterium]